MCYGDGRTAGPGGDVVSHVTIGTNDLARATDFYAALLATVGLDRLPDQETPGVDAGFGQAGSVLPMVFVQRPFDGRPATWGNGVHVAYHAQSRDAVAGFHRAAINCGGTDAGPPGLRPHYSRGYYAAYVRDAVGNKIQAVHRSERGNSK